MCCHAGAKCQEGMSRGDLVKTCVAVAHTAQIGKDDLKRLCETTSDGRAATRAEITKCVFKRMVASIEAGKGPAPPTCTHGSNGHCPLGYEDGPNSCCQPSQAPSGATLATADLAKSSLGMMDTEHMADMMRESGASEKDIAKATAAYRSEEETMEAVIEDQLGDNESDGRKMLSLLKISSEKATQGYAEITAKATKYFRQKTEPSKKDGWLMWGLKKAGSGIMAAIGLAGKLIKTLYGMVSPWVMFAIQNPATMKILTFILLEARKTVCRDISLYLGYKCKLPPKGWGESIAGMLPSKDTMYVAGLTAWAGFQQRGGLKMALNGATSFITGSLGPMVAVATFPIGTIAMGALKVGTSLAADAVEEYAKIATYKAQLSGILGDVLQLFLAPCLQPVDVTLTHQEMENYTADVKSGRIKPGECGLE